MEYYAKIEQKNSKDTESIIKLSSHKNYNTIQYIEIYFDSPANADKKADMIDMTVVIKGKLDTKNRTNAKLMTEWALTNSSSPSAYRNLTVWIIGDGVNNIENPIYKKITLTYAFVVDYKENYDKLTGKDNSTYEITLKQKKDELSEIKIEASGLKFDPAREGFEVEKKEGN